MRKYYWKIYCNDAEGKSQIVVVILTNNQSGDDDHLAAVMEDRICNLLFREDNIGTIYYCELTTESNYLSDMQDLRKFEYIY